MFDSPLKDAVIVLIIVLLFFGPKRLPALSRAIGESVREFRGGIGNGGKKEDPKSEISDTAPASAQPATAQAQATEPVATASERTGG